MYLLPFVLSLCAAASRLGRKEPTRPIKISAINESPFVPQRPTVPGSLQLATNANGGFAPIRVSDDKSNVGGGTADLGATFTDEFSSCGESVPREQDDYIFEIHDI